MIKIVHFRRLFALDWDTEIFFGIFPVHCNFLLLQVFNSRSLIYIKGFPSVRSVNFRSVTSWTLFLVPFPFWSSQSVHPWVLSFLLPLCPFWKDAHFWLVGRHMFHLWVFRCLLILQSGEEMELFLSSATNHPASSNHSFDNIVCH